MGAAASRQILTEPFPVDAALSNDLNRLSMVASRILSTPDIYDVNNLARPGVCGDYAVFLKDNIAKRLLPFVADVSGGAAVEVLYQNPRKSLPSAEMRAAVCDQLATTMLRTIAIVVASLTSIQVAHGSREVAARVVQRGGAVGDIMSWLSNAGYIRRADAAAGGTIVGRRFELVNSRGGAGRPTFSLVFGETRDGLYPASLFATAAAGTAAMPTGALKIAFANPITLPGPPTMAAVSVLPVRITDTGGVPWMVGILHNNMFKSINPTPAAGDGPYDPFDIWEQLFRRTQGWSDPTRPYFERREQTNAANEVFEQFKRLRNPQIILATVERFLMEYVPGYYSGYGPGAGVAGYPGAGPYGYPVAGAALPPMVPGAAAFAPRYPPVGIGAAGARALPALAPAPAGGVDGLRYDIPLSAGRSINDALKLFREAITRESSPAAVRSNTLAAQIYPNRTVQLGICRDPYWGEKNLARILPWAAFQFLCIKDWKLMSAERRSAGGNFEEEWLKFTENLTTRIYTAAPKLEGAGFLDQMRFSGMDKIAGCAGGVAPIITNIDALQYGLEQIRNRYNRHVREVWAILNTLIVVIQDPDAKGLEVVRLHPAVVQQGSSTKYVAAKAAEARKMLLSFYTDIEDLYMQTIRAVLPSAIAGPTRT